MGFYTKIKCPLYGIQDEKEVDEMTQKRLTAMPIKDTILTAQHSTAQHSTAQHSTAQHGLTVPFLCLARHLKLNTTFVMDNRRILTG